MPNLELTVNGRRHALDVPADELSVAVINRYLAMKERLLI